jgi:uncharacterized repeat protein (TIGR01451 family)
MRRTALVWGLLCASWCTALHAQTSSPPSAASPKASAPSAAVAKPATSPIQTQFRALKVHFGKDGKEELENATDASPGDVIEYLAVHRNVSQRRLLNIDFAIPIPSGMTLWEGSIQPASGKWFAAQPASGAAKGKPAAERARVVWRVERLDPGQSVEVKLRVSIDPDPSLAPQQPINPFAPRKPELRRP